MSTKTRLLHQVLAAEKSVKPKAYAALTALYQMVKKPDLFNGLSRTYQSKTDDGEVFPPEKKQIEQTVKDVLRQVSTILADPYDLTLQVCRGNQAALADLEVDGEVLMTGVPATYLLFMEKQLTDVRNVLDGLPVLDPAEEWAGYDVNAGAYRTVAVQTTKTKKVPRVIIKAEATDRHPAQTEVAHEDVTIGTWTSSKLSAALPAEQKRELMRRVDAMLRAVKEAREQANTAEVQPEKVGARVFEFLLRPVLGGGAPAPIAAPQG